MDFYGRQELTEIFDVTLLTIINWENKGRIKSCHVEGNKKFYSLADVMHLLNIEKVIAQKRVLKLQKAQDKLIS